MVKRSYEVIVREGCEGLNLEKVLSYADKCVKSGSKVDKVIVFKNDNGDVRVSVSCDL